MGFPDPLIHQIDQYYYIQMIKSTHLQSVLKLKSEFKSFIDDIPETSYRQWISNASKYMNIKIYHVQKISIKRILQMHQYIVEKFYLTSKIKQEWLQNQLRIFVWVLICYSEKIKINPNSFTISNWQFFNQIFLGKNIQLYQFQFQALKIKQKKFKKWSPKQDQLLLNLLKDQYNHNSCWNRLSKQFYFRSQMKWFRSGKQCRERWNNHLDPNKYRGGEWRLDEDYFLIKQVINKGKRWAMISKQLQNQRTQHMVKNRYKSLITKQQKKQKVKNSLGQIKLLTKLLNRLQNQIQNKKQIKQIHVPALQNLENQQKSQQQVQQQKDFIQEDVSLINFKKQMLNINNKIKIPSKAEESEEQDDVEYQRYQDQKYYPIQEQEGNEYISNIKDDFLKNEGYYSTNQTKMAIQFKCQLINYDECKIENNCQSLFDFMTNLQ